jgi:ribosomal protein L16/L10AE
MALTGNEVQFGEFGIQALEPGWITARQIEAARRAGEYRGVLRCCNRSASSIGRCTAATAAVWR